ncbi:hypothetical protein ACLOJK_008499 [Asimina triloba]
MASVSEYVSRQHLEGAGAATIIIFGYMYIKYRWRMAAPIDISCHRSQMLGMLHGGKMAVQRILDAKWAQTDPSALKDAEQQLKNVLDDLDEKKLDLEQLQRAVAILEMRGKEDRALEMLHDTVKKAQKHEKYEIEMCIVEMHIHKGDYDTALKQDCLQDSDITDARRPLYKALVHVMKGREAEAKHYWEEFQDIQNHLKCDCFHSAQIHSLFVDFEDFKKASLSFSKTK